MKGIKLMGKEKKEVEMKDHPDYYFFDFNPLIKDDMKHFDKKMRPKKELTNTTVTPYDNKNGEPRPIFIPL
jgi:hypothetical protein